MGAVRILLPVPRTLARAHVGLGGPLLGAALLRCLTPGLFLIWWRPPQRLLAWSEEAVAVYRTLHEGPRRRGGDGLALALVLNANALFLAGRYEEALAASDESRTVVGARMSPTQSAYALRVRTLLLTETGRLDEALTAARQCVAAYRKAAPRGREKSLGSYADALRVTSPSADSTTPWPPCAGCWPWTGVLTCRRFMPPVSARSRMPMTWPRTRSEGLGRQPRPSRSSRSTTPVAA
ncbi:tetratricopeptide repeat protein [Streptomyces bobili]|uniref:tetratricopeptide repeat protein n=1 Tax=Streptomyces bobili TaxID=67280 RepID=UPI00341100CF